MITSESKHLNDPEPCNITGTMINFKHLDSFNQNGFSFFLLREKIWHGKHSKKPLSSKRVLLHNLGLGSKVEIIVLMNHAGLDKQAFIYSFILWRMVVRQMQ